MGDISSASRPREKTNAEIAAELLVSNFSSVAIWTKFFDIIDEKIKKALEKYDSDNSIDEYLERKK